MLREDQSSVEVITITAHRKVEETCRTVLHECPTWINGYKRPDFNDANSADCNLSTL